MRWLSCEIAADVYELCKDDPERHFPEASTFTFVWNAVEDCILSAWIKFLQQYRLTHLSLHFDGLRVQGGIPGDIEKLCKDCADCIDRETGFRVAIRPKFHKYFVECLRDSSTHQEDIPDIEDVYLARGNCIALALRCMCETEPMSLQPLEMRKRMTTCELKCADIDRMRL